MKTVHRLVPSIEYLPSESWSDLKICKSRYRNSFRIHVRASCDEEGPLKEDRKAPLRGKPQEGPPLFRHLSSEVQGRETSSFEEAQSAGSAGSSELGAAEQRARPS